MKLTEIARKTYDTIKKPILIGALTAGTHLTAANAANAQDAESEIPEQKKEQKAPAPASVFDKPALRQPKDKSFAEGEYGTTGSDFDTTRIRGQAGFVLKNGIWVRAESNDFKGDKIHPGNDEKHVGTPGFADATLLSEQNVQYLMARGQIPLLGGRLIAFGGSGKSDGTFSSSEHSVEVDPFFTIVTDYNALKTIEKKATLAGTEFAPIEELLFQLAYFKNSKETTESIRDYASLDFMGLFESTRLDTTIEELERKGFILGAAYKLNQNLGLGIEGRREERKIERRTNTRIIETGVPDAVTSSSKENSENVYSILGNICYDSASIAAMAELGLTTENMDLNSKLEGESQFLANAYVVIPLGKASGNQIRAVLSGGIDSFGEGQGAVYFSGGNIANRPALNFARRMHRLEDDVAMLPGRAADARMDSSIGLVNKPHEQNNPNWIVGLYTFEDQQAGKRAFCPVVAVAYNGWQAGFSGKITSKDMRFGPRLNIPVYTSESGLKFYVFGAANVINGRDTMSEELDPAIEMMGGIGLEGTLD